jgi:hypothetical protein
MARSDSLSAQKWRTESGRSTAEASKPPVAIEDAGSGQKDAPEPVRGRSRSVVRKGGESLVKGKGKGKGVDREAEPSRGAASSAKGVEGQLEGKELESARRGRSQSRAESKGKGKEVVREAEPSTAVVAVSTHCHSQIYADST